MEHEGWQMLIEGPDCDLQLIKEIWKATGMMREGTFFFSIPGR